MKNILIKTRYLSLSLLVLYGLSGQAECSMLEYKDSLSSEPVASTLTKLHKEAEEADKPLMESYAMQSLPQSGTDVFEELLKEEKRDYKGVYHKYASNYLNISPEFGQFLYTSVRLSLLT